MTSSSSEPAPADTSRPSAAAQLGLNTAIVEPKYWGGVCLNVGCIPSKALLRNAELAHIFTKEAKTFGINGEATFDYGAAFDRSRKVADGRVAGVHFLMKKNKITEIQGYGTFTDDHTLEVELNDGGTETVTFDNAIIATGASTRLVPGTSLSRERRHLRGADPVARAAVVDRDRRGRARSAWSSATC